MNTKRPVFLHYPGMYSIIKILLFILFLYSITVRSRRRRCNSFSLFENRHGLTVITMEPRFAKSKVRPGKITCDPASQTLLVHYEIEATVIGDYGEKLSTDSKEKVKRYKLKIKPTTDIRRLAEEVVSKSKLIHHSKLEHVENLIFEMQQYVADADRGGGDAGTLGAHGIGCGVVFLLSGLLCLVLFSFFFFLSFTKPPPPAPPPPPPLSHTHPPSLCLFSFALSSSTRPPLPTNVYPPTPCHSQQYRDRGYDDYGRDAAATSSSTNRAKQPPAPTATLDKIDDYMELLYGSMKEKISGTANIVELARDASNLEILSSNNSLMSALARVLKADYKHNIGLSTNIMYVWFSFSNFTQLHGVLTTRRIGSDTIKVIDLEIRRERLRQRELQTKTRIANIQARGGEVPEKLWEELAGRTSKGKDGVIDAGSKEDHPRIDIERERKMTKHLIRKQDKLLFVCFHILLNLAEDVTIEKKMVKKSISGYLTAALGRSSAELLILTVTFLKKLSIFQTGTLSMIDKGIVPRLVTFIPCSNARLMKLTLRLLWNLSFNGPLREQMMTAGLIPKLVKLLEHKEFRSVAIKMLYHMSKDDESKSKIAFSGAIPWVMQLIMKWPAGKIVEELGALAVNLSHSSAGCDFMCQDGGLKILLQRSARHRDAVLMKVVRNISHWTYNKVQPEDEENGGRRQRRRQRRRQQRRRQQVLRWWRRRGKGGRFQLPLVVARPRLIAAPREEPRFSRPQRVAAICARPVQAVPELRIGGRRHVR